MKTFILLLVIVNLAVAQEYTEAEFTRIVIGSRDRAVQFYPDVTNMDSKLVACMVKIDQEWERTGDPNYFLAEKPWIATVLAAKELGILPKTQSSTVKSPLPTRSTVNRGGIDPTRYDNPEMRAWALGQNKDDSDGESDTGTHGVHSTPLIPPMASPFGQTIRLRKDLNGNFRGTDSNGKTIEIRKSLSGDMEVRTR